MSDHVHHLNFVLKELEDFVVDDFLLGDYFDGELVLVLVAGEEDLSVLSFPNHSLQVIGRFALRGKYCFR